MMIKRTKLLLSIAAVTLAACGSGESTPQALLQLELGDSISLKEQQTTTIVPTIMHEKAGQTYEWKQLSGPTLQLHDSNARVLRLTSPELDTDATALVQLTVRDSDGYLVSDTKQITLTANKLPVLTAVASTLTEKTAAVLQVAASDPDGTISAIQWRQVSGPAVLSGTGTSANLSISVPAVSKQTILEFEISATDDSGDVVTIRHSYQIEPILHHFQLGGLLAAAQMTDALVIASAAGQTFRGKADSNAIYNLTVSLDDDETNDVTVLRAISATKPSMELWLMIPSLRQLDRQYPTNLTPFTTGISALVVRANNDTVPRTRCDLAAAEQQVSLKEAVTASMLIAAYPEQNSVSLPEGYNYVFRTIVDKDSFSEFSERMRSTQSALLEQVEYKLTTQGWGKMLLRDADVAQGLRLRAAAGPLVTTDYSSFYRFDANHQARVADPFISYAAQWGVLGGTVQTGANSEHNPVQQFGIDHPDLSLSEEQLQRLQAGGIDRLQVRIKQAGDQLTRFTQGASVSLYQRRSYRWYEIAPVMIGGEQLLFSDSEVETEEYVWASALYPSSLQLQAADIAGLWQLPVYEAHNDGDRQRFTEQYLQFSTDGSGYSRDSGLSFHWQFALDINGQPALTLNFHNGYTQSLRLLQAVPQGYLIDSFVLDVDGHWLAATSARIQKQ